MTDHDDTGEYAIRTRRRRRDYKSLEDGKDEHQSQSQKHSDPDTSKERRVHKTQITSIDTNILKSHEKSTVKQQKAPTSESNDVSKTSGRWTSEEHLRFIEAIKRFGKQWKKVEEFVQTRSGAQIRSHAQKYFLKIQKEYPDQDSFEVFKSKTPEFLEDTIFMK